MANNDNRGFNTVSDSNLSRRDQRMQLQRMTFIAIVGIAILMIVAFLVLIIGSIASSGDSNSNDPVLQDTTVTLTAEDALQGDLVIVNMIGNHEFAESAFTAIEKQLASVTTVYNSHKNFYQYNTALGDRLETQTLNALDAMLVALATETGYNKVAITEGYRSKQDQANLGSSTTNAGFSDHHTGRLCALKVEDANAKAWLTANAHKYGFVTRYPADKVGVTGVPNYTDAYRYVGVAHATKMHELNMCLEEYVDYISKNATEKSPVKVDVNGVNYEVYYYSVINGATVKVPAGYDYTISGTNMGNCIVTIFPAPEATTEAATLAETSAES